MDSASAQNATRQTPGRTQSTDSMNSEQRRAGAKKPNECRRVVAAFADNKVPTSVYGDNYFLPAAVIMENSKGACDYKAKAPPRGTGGKS